MDGIQLSELVDQRLEILESLLRQSVQQAEAIAAGRMSELMSLLAQKQTPLRQLGAVSQTLREAENDDPDQRQWTSPQARDECRSKHRRCESLLGELLRLEAECEAKLAHSRDEIEEKLSRSEGARQAASSYTATISDAPTGARLDLSSD